MNRRTRFLILVSLIVPLIVPTNSFSCGCLGYSPTPEAYKYSSDVFIATVVEIKLAPPKITNNKDGSTTLHGPMGPDIIRLSVEESFKGTQGSEVLTKQGIDTCAYPFEMGQKYLVYGRVEDNYLRADKCTRTRLIKWATSDLKYIRGLEKGETHATLYGEVARDTFNSEGKPIIRTPAEELTVTVESEEIREETRAMIGGQFELTLPPGKYKIWVERNGEVISRPIEPVLLKKDDCLKTEVIVKFK